MGTEPGPLSRQEVHLRRVGKGYVTSEASCAIQWLTETAGASGPIYSAHMRCTSLTAPDEKTELNRIILPKEGGQLSAGPDFQDLTHYQPCLAN